MEAAADGAFVLGFYYWNPVLEKGIAGLTGKLNVYKNTHTSFAIWRGVLVNLNVYTLIFRLQTIFVSYDKH